MKYTIKDRMAKEIYRMRESFGVNDPLKCEVTGKDWNNDKHNNAVNLCLVIRRLANKHRRLAEMSCNGEGWIRGQRYYGGAIDEWAKREYGASVKSAFPYRNYDVNADVSVFDQESDKVEAKITDLVKQLGVGWMVEFQGDPRGWTVKLSYNGRSVDIHS